MDLQILPDEPETLYGDMTASVVKGKAVDIVYLDFRRAFGSVRHNNFTDKLMKCELAK